MRTASEKSVIGKVRARIKEGGVGQLWTYADFKPLPFLAVAAALSRLTNRERLIRRVRRGVYYLPATTRFGELSPDSTKVAEAVLRGRGIEWKSSGLPAYNGLGFTSQVSPVVTFDIPGAIHSLETGSKTKLRIRAGMAIAGMSDKERVTLDAMRDILRIPDASPAKVMSRIKDIISAKELSFRRLAKLALNEPPRVRALLGAIGSELGEDRRTLAPLRNSLNPMTTYRLEMGNTLSTAREWRIR